MSIYIYFSIFLIPGCQSLKKNLNLKKNDNTYDFKGVPDLKRRLLLIIISEFECGI